MDLPFSLSGRKDGTLRYGVSLWYRILLGIIFCLLSSTLALQGTPPSAFGWILLALSAFGVLYEDRWIFDPRAVSHRVGLIFAARRTELSTQDLARLSVVPFVSGTIPGSEDEERENAKALNGENGDGYSGRKWFSWKKRYLLLVLETKDGSTYAIDRVPASRREVLLSAARRISAVTKLQADD